MILVIHCRIPEDLKVQGIHILDLKLGDNRQDCVNLLAFLDNKYQSKLVHVVCSCDEADIDRYFHFFARLVLIRVVHDSFDHELNFLLLT
jgi:hypothetical protein